MSIHTDISILFIYLYILTDIFRGPAVTSLTLKGVEHLYQFFVQEDTVYMRSYKLVEYLIDLCQ